LKSATLGISGAFKLIVFFMEFFVFGELFWCNWIIGTAFTASITQPTLEVGKVVAIDTETCQELGNCFFQNAIQPYSRTVLVDTRSLLPKPDPGLTSLDQYFGAIC